MNMKNYLFLGACLLGFVLFAANAQTAEVTAKSNPALYEVGVSVGTPSGVNLVFGYWGTDTTPLLLRVSGMDYGSNLRGVQVDAGWVFYRGPTFKQYLALSYATSHTEDSDHYYYDFLSIAGPTYGFNWHGFELQAGVGFGTYYEQYYSGPQYKYSSVQLLAQLGYSWLF
jgi:hypothetical protein